MRRNAAAGLETEFRVGLASCGVANGARPVHAAVESAPMVQETEPVFALPGVLRKAQNQSFSTYLLASDRTLYGLVGKTPEIENEITTLR